MLSEDDRRGKLLQGASPGRHTQKGNSYQIFEIHLSPPVFHPLKGNHAVVAFGDGFLDFPDVEMESRPASRKNERDGPPRICMNRVKETGEGILEGD